MALTLRYKRENSKKQPVWAYIRRNNPFRVGDVMVIQGVEQKFMKNLLWNLERAGYVRLENEPELYRDRVYTLIKNTGSKSPSIGNGYLYDHNTGENIEIKGKRQGNTTRSSYYKMLKAMTSKLMTRSEIAEAAGLKLRGGNAGRCFLRLVNEAIMVETEQKQGGKKVYLIDTALRARTMREIEEQESDDVDGTF